MHIAEPLVPDPSTSEVEITIVNLKNYKSSGIDQIPTELIQAGGEILLRPTNSLILFGIRKNCLMSGRILLFYQFTEIRIKMALVIIVI
jgi:hypothetical protein